MPLLDVEELRSQLLTHPLPIYFGGSFQPFHRGHMAIATSLRQNFIRCPVSLLPNQISPFKLRARHHLDTASRLALLQAALQDLEEELQLAVPASAIPMPTSEPLLQLELWELQHPGPSYTADTLRSLLDKKGLKNCVFALGWDSFSSLEHWKDWEYLHKVCLFAVFHRQENCRHAPKRAPTGANYLLLDLDLPFASRDIRHLLARGEMSRKLREMLGPRVAAYIVQHRLYQDSD